MQLLFNVHFSAHVECVHPLGQPVQFVQASSAIVQAPFVTLSSITGTALWGWPPVFKNNTTLCGNDRAESDVSIANDNHMQ